jgi:uncharacterized membrane protein
MLTNLYLDTTNPKLHFTDMFGIAIFAPLLVSVIIHTFAYTAFANIVSYIFYDKFLSSEINFRLVVFLLVIMFLGFFARFFHVKEIYAAYGGDMAKTRNHLDQLYVGWIFIS